ncbi:MAG TPA: hypothetical protein VD861_16475, partial [Pyrinomonadaceae bacterium]|nr:hypothetical protein [Pyrinomonadaceae bacterium]
MKRIASVLSAIVLVTGLAFASPQHGGHGGHGAPAAPAAKKSTAKKRAAAAPARGRERVVTGFISDTHCGLSHSMEGMDDEKTCALHCAVQGGGKFVLADRAGKVVYSLDADGQQKAREFAGQRVKVT